MTHTRRTIGTILGVALAGTLTACISSPDGPGATGTPTPTEEPAPVDAEFLVGTWTALPADDSDPAVVQFGDAIRIWARCGLIEADYSLMSDGGFVTSPASWSEDCGQVTWLPQLGTLVRAGDDLIIEDAARSETARLTPGGTPKVPDTVDSSLAQDPVLSDELREKLTPTQITLPSGTRAATTADLERGRWFPAVPAEEDPEGSWVEFATDGKYTGSDGCNGAGGSWRLADGGAFAATTGPQTLMACPGVPVADELYTAKGIALTEDEDFLVLLDASSQEVGRYVTDIKLATPKKMWDE